MESSLDMGTKKGNVNVGDSKSSDGTLTKVQYTRMGKGFSD